MGTARPDLMTPAARHHTQADDWREARRVPRQPQAGSNGPLWTTTTQPRLHQGGF